MQEQMWCLKLYLLQNAGQITWNNEHLHWQKYQGNKNITCSSNHLIYSIHCKKCNKEYVGQTDDSLQKWFEGHKGNICCKNRSEDIGFHFNSVGHSGFSDMKVHMLEFLDLHLKSKEGHNLRLQVEFNWIHRLRTMLPMGINTKDSSWESTESRNWMHHKDTQQICDLASEKITYLSIYLSICVPKGTKVNQKKDTHDLWALKICEKLGNSIDTILCNRSLTHLHEIRCWEVQSDPSLSTCWHPIYVNMYPVNLWWTLPV